MKVPPFVAALLRAGSDAPRDDKRNNSRQDWQDCKQADRNCPCDIPVILPILAILSLLLFAFLPLTSGLGASRHLP